MFPKPIVYKLLKFGHRTSKNAIWTLFWVLYGSYIHTKSQPVSKRAIIKLLDSPQCRHLADKIRFLPTGLSPFLTIMAESSLTPNSPLRVTWRLYTCDISSIPPYECLRGGGKPWSCLSATLCFDGIASDHAYSPLPRHEILEGLSHISSPTDAMMTNTICSMISFARAIQPATLRSTQTKRCKMRAKFDKIFSPWGTRVQKSRVHKSETMRKAPLFFFSLLEVQHLGSPRRTRWGMIQRPTPC